MSMGRCAGCGETSASCKFMMSHIMACPDYVALFKSDPDKALSPEAEYERFRADESVGELKAAMKEERLTRRFAEMDAIRDEQASRWNPPGLLDD